MKDTYVFMLIIPECLCEVLLKSALSMHIPWQLWVPVYTILLCQQFMLSVIIQAQVSSEYLIQSVFLKISRKISVWDFTICPLLWTRYFNCGDHACTAWILIFNFDVASAIAFGFEVLYSLMYSYWKQIMAFTSIHDVAIVCSVASGERIADKSLWSVTKWKVSTWGTDKNVTPGNGLPVFPAFFLCWNA